MLPIGNLVSQNLEQGDSHFGAKRERPFSSKETVTFCRAQRLNRDVVRLGSDKVLSVSAGIRLTIVVRQGVQFSLCYRMQPAREGGGLCFSQFPTR